MYNIVFEKSVTVSAKGIICSVFLIIMVLVAVTSILACFKRKLSTIVSIIYIFIYFLFVIVSLGFVYKWFECPVWNKYPRKTFAKHCFDYEWNLVGNSLVKTFYSIQLQQLCKLFFWKIFSICFVFCPAIIYIMMDHLWLQSSICMCLDKLK